MDNKNALTVDHNEAAALIRINGSKVSYVIEGEPGVGKSSILKTLQGQMGNEYEYIYIDVPLKDIPDIALSMPNHDTKTTVPYVNSIWYGKDKLKPKVVMLDEVFKGSEYVKLMMNRLLLEHMVGDYALPEGSIVFGTTNNASDGVGDKSNGHTNSRVVRVRISKPSQAQWTQWAVDNKVDGLVLAWVAQNPAVFNSYKDTAFDPRLHKDGQGVFHYIYHPQHNNVSYVCPRTLEMASHQLKNIGELGDALITKALVGTIGSKAALDMSALIALGSDLPHPNDIIKEPTKARIPKSAPAQLMMLYKSMQYLDAENMDSFVTYFKRMPLEMTSTWIKTVVASQAVMEFAIKNKQITAFAIENSWVI